MRLAIIDLGTNSVRFDVHECEPGGKVRRLHREKLMVRLGQGVFVRGKLDPRAVIRTLHAFTRFKRLAIRLHVSRIVAFGTSALRDARDRDEFVKRVKSQTGITVRVISGTEEAKLIAAGVLANETTPDKGRFALLDIGGGSTEISICRDEKVSHSYSFALGTARVQQIFLRKSPPKAESIESLRKYVRNTLYQVLLPERWPKTKRVIASSGTARALARLIHPHKLEFNLKDLSKLVKTMSKLDATGLAWLPRMEPKRVDMILAGAVVFEECMRVLGAQKTRFTEYSLRDGILREEVLRLNRADTSLLAPHQGDLIEVAERFGAARPQLVSLSKASDLLFDRLKKIHTLDKRWKPVLAAAAVLRNTGEAIRLVQPEAHSCYIVRNLDMPAAEPWEQELIARLCLNLPNEKEPDSSGLPTGKNGVPFEPLLALLRILDGLDSASEDPLALQSVRISGKRIELVLNDRRSSGLEATHVELRKRLFERIFKRTIRVVYK